MIAVTDTPSGNAYPAREQPQAEGATPARLFGLWVRRRRRQTGQTVTQTARAATMDPYAWRALEAGLLPWETVSTALPRIARGLDIPLTTVAEALFCILLAEA